MVAKQAEIKAVEGKIDAAKDKIIREANEKARAILQEAKDVADETIRDFNKLDKNRIKRRRTS